MAANPDGSLGIFGHNGRPEPISITFRIGDGPTVHVDIASWGIFSVRAPLDPAAMGVLAAGG